MFSRSAAFRRHLDGGGEPDERLRLSGRHLRLVVVRRQRHDHGPVPHAGDRS